MRAAISVEWLKLRRSRISMITFMLVGLGCPALTAGFLAGAARVQLIRLTAGDQGQRHADR
jgi:hypothetical protein